MSEQPGMSSRLRRSVVASRPRVLWGRRIAFATAGVFFVSSLFPLAAGISKHTDAFPKWWGTLDVGIAFVLALLVLVMQAFARGKLDKQAEESSYRAHRILIHAIFVGFVVFALIGERVNWGSCLSGFAWRFWLLLYCLPSWFASLRC
ncbi:MAG: hypothetical protein ABSF95_20825 [Verrucomicrobiota bacterium]